MIQVNFIYSLIAVQWNMFRALGIILPDKTAEKISPFSSILVPFGAR
jgi:hypothetical protein